MKFLVISILIALLSIFNFATAATNENAQSLGHFTWGSDIGSSIDIAGNDMSSIDVDAYFGYKNPTIRTFGIGAGIKSAIAKSYTFIPVYAILRTSFTSKPSLCFMDLKLGYSFNALKDNTSQNSFYGSAGIGFNLHTSSKFKSHIILSYTFMDLDGYYINGLYNDINKYSAMSIKIGINF